MQHGDDVIPIVVVALK